MAKPASAETKKKKVERTTNTNGPPVFAIAGAVFVVLIAVAVALAVLQQPASGGSREAAASDSKEAAASPSGSKASPADIAAKVAKKASAASAALAVKVAKKASAASAASASPFRWSPKTLSVVLPCAGEGLFAKKTVQSVADSVPGGIGGSILADIIVVDDGSSPPLGEEYLTPDFRTKYPVTIVRHEVAVGLMGAKSAGATKATGDIIVFFDCHVAPQDTWYEEFLVSSAENYRRIVVPVITDLNIDTWKERNRAWSFAKCYLTWDADFKWVNMEQPHMPVLSGGLLGISRRWWNETGGYDPGMKGWGGENIDQSLRTWLCGGEIVSLSKAFVAHMWRQPQDTRTDRNYEVSVMDALKNKARAVLGWFDDYAEKAGEFQTLNWLGIGSKRRNLDKLMAQMGLREKPNLNTDISAFQAVRDQLSCKPFAWFLWRFRHLYVDGGLLPPETYQLKEVSSGQCLTFIGPMGVHPQGAAHAALLPCNKTGLPDYVHPDSQRWHMRNKKPATGKCCSALGSWNTDQCITHLANEGMFATAVCDVSGQQVAAWALTEDGQITFQGRCAIVDKKAGPLEFGKGVRGPKLRLAKCKPNAPARWLRVAVQVPLETELYEKALLEKPELFKDE